ncbi:MAG: [citrate (pro-3S)-lyase] ligase [Eubacteriales bacterium]|nr:[citrate (pro-3S)-lyase] ligase [Eubacteriales bacterium]
MELEYDEGIEYTVCVLNEEYQIIGTGSVEKNVIKCVAIDPAYQGQGYSATILSALIQYEFDKAVTHLFIYTKPKNLDMFADMGFHTILMTKDILFMENRSRGFESFMRALREETPEEALRKDAVIGAVVANCNPFTLGHRYLLEEALKRCDYLHLFILSDDRGAFRAEERYAMVQAGIRDMERVILHRTSDYMISAATFPTYFFKDKLQAKTANCRLDLELFASRIAPELSITKRFVGTEPGCNVTRQYNEEMKKILPDYGITVEEIKRKELEGSFISASRVRSFLETREYDEVKQLVPEDVFELLVEKGRP